MTKILLAPLVCLAVSACVSNFGEHSGMALRQGEEAVARNIVKGKTTVRELSERYGRFFAVPGSEPGRREWCTYHHETELPFYNFLPTNFLYMSATRTAWTLCLTADSDDVVRDYRFEKTVKRDKTVLSGFIE